MVWGGITPSVSRLQAKGTTEVGKAFSRAQCGNPSAAAGADSMWRDADPELILLVASANARSRAHATHVTPHNGSLAQPWCLALPPVTAAWSGGR
jgi:hypothetical protein